MAQNKMSHAATFWVRHPRHTEHAGTGDTRGTSASASPWQLGKLQLKGWGSHGSPGGHSPSQDTKLQCLHLHCARQGCRLSWQIHLAQRAEQGGHLPDFCSGTFPGESPGPSPSVLFPWHQVLLVSRARAALTSGTWAWQVGEAGQGAIPAGKPGGEGACRCWDMGHRA